MTKQTPVKYPCARCLKGVIAGQEKTLEIQPGGKSFGPVKDPKGDIWQFGPDCYRKIIKNGGRKDW